ncbi:AAA-like domain-containing protein [Thermocoleostomius sinensis]|uniref:AAA-like domain-containing protein n=1 Tax=Thermocoleostomius sinensis A174 TaxID=2016057 RepID=A0A9E8ZDP1_9CYAN|nr:AAA-like domain-containing protein [Thermocoleostomius sinensis]WAL61404.1 AAA-like domain-containing protein [Thermocoleostomius sinensis A174]
MKPSKEDFQLGDYRPEWGNSSLPNSEFYIERPLVTTCDLHDGLVHTSDHTPSFLTVEAACHAAILQPGALLRIKGAEQMGKTSLLLRLLHQKAQQNFDVALLSLKAVEPSMLQDIDALLQWFCQQVTVALQLPNYLDDYWDDVFGSSISCKSYFEEYLLLQSSQPLVLALDDVDRLFPYIEVADEFLGLLRAWHEDAKTRDTWKKVRLVLSHTADVYIPLNLHKSPFNVGVPIELIGFTQTQVQTF